MKKFSLFIALLALTVVFSIKNVFAGPPFNNLEGVGGVALTHWRTLLTPEKNLLR